MPRRIPGLSQVDRILVALGYLIYLMLLAWVVNGQAIPPFGLSGLWFYSAFGALILGDFVVEPYFTRPADALANGVALLLAVSSVSASEARAPQALIDLGRLAFMLYAALGIALAVCAMAFKDSAGRLRSFGRLAYEAAGMAGSSRVVFSLLLFAAIFAAFANNPSDLTILYLSWILIFVGRPMERIVAAKSPMRTRADTAVSVEEVIDPGLSRARVHQGGSLDVGTGMRLRGGSDELGVVVDATVAMNQERIWIASTRAKEVHEGSELEAMEGHERRPAIGYVVDRTDLVTAVVRTYPNVSKTRLSEGSMLLIRIRDQAALYQVTAAIIDSASEAHLARHLQYVHARKLGVWDDDKERFEQVSWLPAPGAVVELVDSTSAAFNPRYIGCVPGTKYGARLLVNTAVTHNTAIVGILGAGKTHLAWEIISRSLSEGVRVIVLDITGRYSPHFARIIRPARSEGVVRAKINSAIKADIANDTVRHSEAGNVIQFKGLLADEITSFVNSTDPILVLNPNAFEVTRMEGKPFGCGSSGVTS